MRGRRAGRPRAPELLGGALAREAAAARAHPHARPPRRRRTVAGAPAGARRRRGARRRARGGRRASRRVPPRRRHVWTRKQAGVPAHGTVALDGGPPRGRSPRGDRRHRRLPRARDRVAVGGRRRRDPAGTPLAFNLVEGVNDPPEPATPRSPSASSARCGWRASRTRSPQSTSRATSRDRRRRRLAAALHRGGRAQPPREPVGGAQRLPRAVRDVRGTLPGGIELAHGLGVVEHHRARW